MRASWRVKGLKNNIKSGELMKETEFQVNYTSDHIGKTISIGDIETGFQFTIPFDGIFKEITRGK